MKKIKMLYLLRNPIQYQSPMLQQLAQEPILDLKVLYRTKMSLREHVVPDTDIKVKWDIPLLDGYQHEFLPCIGRDDHWNFFRPFNYGLFKIFRKERPDIFWVHGYTDYYSLYAIVLAKLFSIKVLVRGESTLMSAEKSGLKRMTREIFFRILNKLVDGFLYVGTLNKEFYLSFNIPLKKLFFCPYTVDNSYFEAKSTTATEVGQLRQTLGLDPKRPVILFASRMIERKRQDDLLTAYLSLSSQGMQEPFPYLLFIGDGNCKAALEARAKTYKLSSIQFLGFKNQSELPLYYALADVFVLPSERENWGLVLNEAMSAGCAIIASDQIGAARDLVQNDVNGFVYKTGDVDQLASNLRQTTVSLDICQRMGEASKNIIRTWDIKQTADGVLLACKQLCNIQN